MSWQILIDIGGTATKVCVATGGRIVHRTEFASFKPQPFDNRTADLCRSLGTWLASMDETLLHPSFVLIGTAGVWGRVERQSYLNAFTDAWLTYVDVNMPRCSVLSDMELSMFAAFGNNTGLLLIAGTGSIAAQGSAGGTITRCGGWGPRIDDAGSGLLIGKEALRAVARMLDGRGASTLLVRPVAAYLRCSESDTETLSAALRSANTDGAARLAQAVLQYAEEADEVAQDIRHAAASALAELVVPLIRQSHEPPTEICLHGSLFVNEAFTRCFGAELKKVAPTMTCSVLTSMMDNVALRLQSSTGEL